MSAHFEAADKKGVMKTMSNAIKRAQDFSLSLTVKASAKETMDKISQVNLWWAKIFKGHADRLIDEFAIHFEDTFVNFGISEFVPNKKIVWLVTDYNLHWIETIRNGNTHKSSGRYLKKTGRPRSLLCIRV